MGNLSNLYISQSFQSLAHLGTNTSLVPGTMTQLQDGVGQSLNIYFDGTNISSSGNIYGANITGSGGGSINTGSLVTTSSFNAYTSSNDSKVNQLIAATASYAISSSVAAVDAAQQSQINNLIAVTGSYVTSAITASSLVTASVNLNTITFTKGNGSTFNITVNTGSGGGGTTDISSLNAFTASQETKDLTLASVTSSLNSATASLFASASLALVTASFSGNTLTFTKGDASTFGVVIPDVSGSNINTASFATTGSNQFNGNQSISGSVTLSGSLNNVNYIDFNTASATPTWKSGRVFWDNTDSCLAVYNAEADITLQVGQENWTRVYNGTGATIANGAAVRLSGTQGDVPSIVLAQSIAISGSANITNQILGLATHTIETGTFGFITTQGLVRGLNTNAFTDGATLYVSTSAGLLTTTAPPTPYEKIPIGQCVKASPGGSGIIYVAVEQPIDFSDLSSVVVGTYSDSDMWVYEGSGVSGSWQHRNKTQVGLTTTSSFNAYTSSTNSRLNNIEAATSSYVTSAITASSLITASFSGNTLTFTKGDASTFGVVIPDVSGSTINTGSFATTGSNIFTGDQTFIDNAGNFFTISDTSGSMLLVAKTFTSASSHITASTSTQVNVIFKNNSGTDNTVVSGSNNIFVNATGTTAGFKRYIGGNGSVAMGPTHLPQISSSMAFSPVMNNNYLNSANGFLMRGPVSSSTWTISNNYFAGVINIGGAAGQHAEKLTGGLNMNSNLIQGNLTLIANQSALTGSNTVFNNNSMNGNVTLYLSSSAVALANNIINDSNFQLDNRFYSSSLGLGSVAMNRNNIGGQSNSIIISGALPTGTTTTNSISDNFIFGGSNTLYVDVANARVSGSTAYINAVRNGLMGNQLIVSASSLLADNSSYGSVFVGRYNADDARRNKSSDVVFAVGTGNTTTRKTGFLIDSGSNTFVEGTLNISGSTSFTGSAPSILSGSFSGSLITNLTDTYTDVASVQQIVSLSSGSYAGLISGSLTNTNTLYIIV